jgi:hypothetical protein
LRLSYGSDIGDISDIDLGLVSLFKQWDVRTLRQRDLLTNEVDEALMVSWEKLSSIGDFN